MRMHRSLLFAGLLLAALFLLLPAQSMAQKLPKGVKAELIAEYPGQTAGIAKVLLMKFTFQPGAIIKNMTEAHTAL